MYFKHVYSQYLSNYMMFRNTSLWNENDVFPKDFLCRHVLYLQPLE